MVYNGTIICKGRNMSFAGPIAFLNPYKIKENFNISLLKKYSISHKIQENILKKLAFIETFEEISRWVEKYTNGDKFIACPTNTSHEDRSSCLNYLQELLLQTIKGQNKRKDGRDLKLIKAAKAGDYYAIACILASAAWSYWQTYLLTNGNITFYAKNQQKNKQKSELKKAQIEHIGAALSFEKARKKGAFQEYLDFDETEEILKNNNFED